MRRVFTLAVIAACSKPVEHHRVDKIELPNFTIVVPAGWDEVTDKRVVPAINTQGVHAIMMDPSPKSGFVPSIALQQLAMSPDDHAMLMHATDEQCQDDPR